MCFAIRATVANSVLFTLNDDATLFDGARDIWRIYLEVPFGNSINEIFYFLLLFVDFIHCAFGTLQCFVSLGKSLLSVVQ